jgi:hypothetical protein
MHPGAIGVEDANHFDVQTMLAMVVEEQCFRAKFPLVISSTESDGVDIAPVRFRLRVNSWIAVHFTC